jgi:hypothetical protein
MEMASRRIPRIPTWIIEWSWQECVDPDLMTLARFSELFGITYRAFCDVLDRHRVNGRRPVSRETFIAIGRETCRAVQAQGIGSDEIVACLGTFRRLGLGGDDYWAFFLGWAEASGNAELAELATACLSGWRGAVAVGDAFVIPEQRPELRPKWGYGGV